MSEVQSSMQRFVPNQMLALFQEGEHVDDLEVVSFSENKDLHSSDTLKVRSLKLYPGEEVEFVFSGHEFSKGDA